MAATTPFDSPPDLSLQTILAFKGPVLVDLDETLYLRNSTEDFLDCARPGVLAFLLLKVLDVVKPWRVTGGDATRDVWRVRTVGIFAPWTMLVWRRRVAALAGQFRNAELTEVLRSRGEPPIISTIGFHPIVKPLIAALGFAEARLVCARTNFDDRRDGKLVLVSRELGHSVVQCALVVTDSVDDLPLLEACASPLRTIWPAAKYRTALDGIYLPGRYLSQVKRPGERYIWRGVLQEDFALWVLSAVGIMSHPAPLVFGLLFLLASFWAIYERGYVDNDWVAANLEANPKLSATYRGHTLATPFWQPWIWAAVLGGVGVWILSDSAQIAVNGVKWAAVLVGTELWFRAYNRFDKMTRAWMYSVLQLARSAAFAVIVPITPAGAAALAAHTLSRWVPYYAYRLDGKSWPSIQASLIQLLFYLVLAGFIAIADGIGVLANPPAFLILVWCIFRARGELRSTLASIHRLRPADRDKTP
jgi:hypothetical protein